MTSAFSWKNSVSLSVQFSSVDQLCPTLCDPMDYSLPGSSICGILQARILDWVAISFSRRSSQPRDWTRVSPSLQADILDIQYPLVIRERQIKTTMRLLIVLSAILIPACATSSPVFLTICSAYTLNKQNDNIQPWRTPFPIWNQSVVPCPVLLNILMMANLTGLR